MAVHTPAIPAVKSTPAPTAVGAADTIPVGSSGRYLVIIKNGGGTPDNVVIDDPTSQSPPGSTTALNPDLTESVPATTGERHFFLEAARFRDANGNINLTHSFQTSVTCLVYGPF
jgi:hypothetical protein